MLFFWNWNHDLTHKLTVSWILNDWLPILPAIDCESDAYYEQCLLWAEETTETECPLKFWKTFYGGNAVMPFLCRGVWFLPKFLYHGNVRLDVYLSLHCNKQHLQPINALSSYYWGIIKSRLNKNGMRTVYLSIAY